MTGKRETRKRAYRYVMTQTKKLNLDLMHGPDETITDVNYDLVGLKEGPAGPPQELVVALKKLLKDVASEAEIDEYLVRPFSTKSRRLLVTSEITNSWD